MRYFFGRRGIAGIPSWDPTIVVQHGSEPPLSPAASPFAFHSLLYILCDLILLMRSLLEVCLHLLEHVVDPKGADDLKLLRGYLVSLKVQLTLHEKAGQERELLCIRLGPPDLELLWPVGRGEHLDGR